MHNGEYGSLIPVGWTHAWSDGSTGVLHENYDPRPAETSGEDYRIVTVYVRAEDWPEGVPSGRTVPDA